MPLNDYTKHVLLVPEDGDPCGLLKTGELGEIVFVQTGGPCD